jgi:hypothetical protein
MKEMTLIGVSNQEYRDSTNLLKKLPLEVIVVFLKNWNMFPFDGI